MSSAEAVRSDVRARLESDGLAGKLEQALVAALATKEADMQTLVAASLLEASEVGAQEAREVRDVGCHVPPRRR